MKWLFKWQVVTPIFTLVAQQEEVLRMMKYKGLTELRKGGFNFLINHFQWRCEHQLTQSHEINSSTSQVSWRNSNAASTLMIVYNVGSTFLNLMALRPGLEHPFSAVPVFVVLLRLDQHHVIIWRHGASSSHNCFPDQTQKPVTSGSVRGWWLWSEWRRVIGCSGWACPAPPNHPPIPIIIKDLTLSVFLVFAGAPRVARDPPGDDGCPL